MARIVLAICLNGVDIHISVFIVLPFDLRTLLISVKTFSGGYSDENNSRI
jgi:hypothetical protein